jgi:hypothetical protein
MLGDLNPADYSTGFNCRAVLRSRRCRIIERRVLPDSTDWSAAFQEYQGFALLIRQC